MAKGSVQVISHSFIIIHTAVERNCKPTNENVVVTIAVNAQQSEVFAAIVLTSLLVNTYSRLSNEFLPNRLLL